MVIGKPHIRWVSTKQFSEQAEFMEYLDEESNLLIEIKFWSFAALLLRFLDSIYARFARQSLSTVTFRPFIPLLGFVASMLVKCEMAELPQHYCACWTNWATPHWNALKGRTLKDWTCGSSKKICLNSFPFFKVPKLIWFKSPSVPKQEITCWHLNPILALQIPLKLKPSPS